MTGKLQAFELHICIWPSPILKVKVNFLAHLDNIVEMVADRIKISVATNSKSCLSFWLVYLHFTLAILKVKFIKFKVKHISHWISWKWWQIRLKLLLPSNSKSYMGFWLTYYIWPRPILKNRVKVMHTSTKNIRDMVTDRVKVNITIAINRKSCVGFRFVYLHLILAHSRGQGRKHLDTVTDKIRMSNVIK